MTVQEPGTDTTTPAAEARADAVTGSEPPADAADRLRDAEDALTTFYARVVDVEAVLAAESLRADKAEEKLELAERRLVKQNEALAVAARVAESEAHLRERVAELDSELRRAHEEIHALHNSRTMRTVAIPRRIYAKLRSIVGR